MTLHCICIEHSVDFTVRRYIQKYSVSMSNAILTLLPQDKMATISQTIFSDAFSWMKVLYFD